MAIKRTELAHAILHLKKSSGVERKRLARDIAGYLIAERRTKELNSLLRDIEDLEYKKDGILEVTAMTARPLSVTTKAQIAKLFDAKQVKIHEEINEETLGGVRVRALDKVVDLSVQARLQRLRKG
jgi:ATP synthase F1 delta subunit